MTEDSPPPPATLPEPQDAEIVAHRGPLARIYKRGGAHPSSWSELRYLGPLAGARFDPDPEPPGPTTDVGVAYAAVAGRYAAFETAVAEVYQITRTIDPGPELHWLATWTPEAPLELLDLSSAWTLRAEGTQALTAGDRARSRQWARAIHSRLSDRIDGLLWSSSVLGGGRAVVLWERAAESFPARPAFNRYLGDPALQGPLAAAAQLLGYRMI